MNAQICVIENCVAPLLEVVTRGLNLAPRVVHDRTNLLALLRCEVQHARHALKRPLARQRQQTIAINQCRAAEANCQPNYQSEETKQDTVFML